MEGLAGVANASQLVSASAASIDTSALGATVVGGDGSVLLAGLDRTPAPAPKRKSSSSRASHAGTDLFSLSRPSPAKDKSKSKSKPKTKAKKKAKKAPRPVVSVPAAGSSSSSRSKKHKKKKSRSRSGSSSRRGSSSSSRHVRFNEEVDMGGVEGYDEDEQDFFMMDDDDDDYDGEGGYSGDEGFGDEDGFEGGIGSSAGVDGFGGLYEARRAESKQRRREQMYSLLAELDELKAKGFKTPREFNYMSDPAEVFQVVDLGRTVIARRDGREMTRDGFFQMLGIIESGSKRWGPEFIKMNGLTANCKAAPRIESALEKVHDRYLGAMADVNPLVMLVIAIGITMGTTQAANMALESQIGAQPKQQQQPQGRAPNYAAPPPPQPNGQRPMRPAPAPPGPEWGTNIGGGMEMGRIDSRQGVTIQDRRPQQQQPGAAPASLVGGISNGIIGAFDPDQKKKDEEVRRQAALAARGALPNAVQPFRFDAKTDDEASSNELETMGEINRVLGNMN